MDELLIMVRDAITLCVGDGDDDTPSMRFVGVHRVAV